MPPSPVVPTICININSRFSPTGSRKGRARPAFGGGTQRRGQDAARPTRHGETSERPQARYSPDAETPRPRGRRPQLRAARSLSEPAAGMALTTESKAAKSANPFSISSILSRSEPKRQPPLLCWEPGLLAKPTPWYPWVRPGT
ncbi:hypothetical protein MTO96_021258 [Rhipicephalus appendiculatus]